MKVIRLWFLAIMIVFLSVSFSQAQSNTISAAKEKGITAKQLNIKPTQSQPSTGINVPDAANIGIVMFKNLSIGPIGSGTNGRRLCPLTISNTSAHSLSNEYMMKYWWRGGSSAPWDHYYGCTMQWNIPAHKTKTIDIQVTIPSGATEFRVTLHDSPTNPKIIAEISAPVPN
ncbi:MAG: hypothetical protein M0P57_15195 [Syntrophales bacterium]|jgi:hypothetical protein|nr:hypothetical protein [Syntrophales bacterium]MDY0044932.1 hypothetical protein [Syntrophales bacterium]